MVQRIIHSDLQDRSVFVHFNLERSGTPNAEEVFWILKARPLGWRRFSNTPLREVRGREADAPAVPLGPTLPSERGRPSASFILISERSSVS